MITRKTSVAGAIALLLAAQLLGSCASLEDTKSSPGLKTSDQESLKSSMTELELKFAQAQLRNREALKNFDDSLSKLEADYIPKFALAATKAADKAAEKESILYTVYCLAKDKIYDRHETEAYLDKNIGPALRQTVDSFASDVEKLATKLDGDLRFASIDLATKMQSPGSGTVSDIRLESPTVQSWTEFDKTLQRLGYDVPKSGIRFTLSATPMVSSALPQVIRSIGAISLRTFGTVASRLAFAGSILGPILAVEGPVPIAKIISALGLAWTAYDLTQLQPRFRGDVLDATKNQLATAENTIVGQARNFGREKMSAFDKMQIELRDQEIRRL